MTTIAAIPRGMGMSIEKAWLSFYSAILNTAMEDAGKMDKDGTESRAARSAASFAHRGFCKELCEAIEIDYGRFFQAFENKRRTRIRDYRRRLRAR